ncbi:MAG: SAM-dependent methyltransferase [Desulfatibacillaceae bacterium]
MTPDYETTAEKSAREYYNSEDADNFYYIIWGGEDLHLGIYDTPDESIFDASRRTVQRMAETLDKPLDANTQVVDLGAGFGGSARYLAKTYGCKVTCVNISERENERNRKMNREQGLDHLIDVVDGSFESVPLPDDYCDVVWSQDAILHSSDRDKVVQEIARIVKPGGEVVFTDPMQSDNCSMSDLSPILARINLETLGSPAFYLEAGRKHGLGEGEFTTLTPHLTRHYSRILEETEANEGKLEGAVSQEYIDRMKTGLGHWIEGGKQSNLAWGIFHFKK